jgi:hypothetical protein
LTPHERLLTNPFSPRRSRGVGRIPSRDPIPQAFGHIGADSTPKLPPM